MRSIYSMRHWGTLGALSAWALLAACAPGRDAAQAEGADTATAAGVRIVNVEVAPAAPGAFHDYIRITGEVAALHDVTLSAEESGRVARFHVEKGARVAAGQAIASIDDAVLGAQVDEARALAELAREQFARQRRLWEEDRVGSEIAYLQAKAAWEQAAARLATLEARRAHTVVRSSVAGTFDEKFVEPGEMVSPGAPVARILAVHRVKIVGGVPERFALAVRPGDTAHVRLDVLPDREMAGQIAFVGASVDARSRTVPIEIVLDNPAGLAKPHMVANVLIQRARREGVLVVPQEVVRRTEDGYQLFVAQQQGDRLLARVRAVTLGPSYANRVVIEQGLSVGDSVIVVGHRLVDDGSRVRIVHVRQGN